ncbi:hypothetical protein [Cryobacterium sp. CG_9.6]|uniref:hypothetical protein n=1 Tax=Cryobacterium sp. CG_9.6 TaxID=2760710 RepID=UPI002476AB3A|nr:hypothetical protein [Cryobacterium sp. CG_9.6]MDH6237386.1 hypothetical protein [Cryobacterium sp. CG_9.6]
MSTSLTTSPGERGAGEQSSRSFRRTLGLLLGSLVVMCLVLVGINILNGPRLTGFEIDTTAAVSQTNARLVLSANQQLLNVAPEQITLSPAHPFSLQTSADSIVISFTNPLAYDTDYTVTVRDVTGSSTNRSSTFEVDFRTQEPPLFYLLRDDVGPDRILRTRIGSPTADVAFEAPRITEFTTFGERLVVVTLDDTGASVLSLIDEEGVLSNVNVPGIGQIEDLGGVPAENLVGFRFTSAADAPGPLFENVLFMLDLGLGITDPILGLDGEPVQAVQWSFMAGRADLVAQLYDGTILLLNPRTNADASAEPIPLGQYSGLTTVAPDGLRIAVADQGSQFVLDLSTGTEDQIMPAEVLGTTPYTDELRFLAGGGFVQRMAQFDPVTGQPKQRLTLVQGEERRVVYEPASAGETIVGFTLSPNDQYAAVQIIPNRDDQMADDYPVNGQVTAATTLFVDLATGEIRRSVVGFDATWR